MRLGLLECATSAGNVTETLASRRFLIVTGKGGVGKTTVCAAQAHALAAGGKRVLIAMCNAKERLSAMTGSASIGPDIAEVAPNVWAVNMDPERALEEYGMLMLGSRALYKVIFHNAYVRTFFRAVPGMQEWAMLGKAWWHTTEVRPDGSPRYDVVILDAPATGHGLDMLRVPKVIQEVVPPGLLRRDAERALRMFRDPTTCGVVLVTLPEEMPATETLELASALKNELLLPIGRVVVNFVLPRLFSAVEASALAAVRFDGDERWDSAVAAARARAAREHVQAESLVRLADGLGVGLTYVPQLFEDAATPHAIAVLARALA